MIDPAAATFESVAEEYELGRPSWPGEAVEAAGLPRSAAVCDLGAGTGKLTRVLRGHFERVITVEPLDGMRALIPGESLKGTAEEIPLPDESLDGVFCGESFHWFDWPLAVPEIARVLAPGGALTMLWNRGRLGFSAEVEAVLSQVDHAPGDRRYQAFAWRDALEQSPLFEPLRREVFPNREEITAEQLVARIGSWSNLTTLPPRERLDTLERLRAVLTEPAYEFTLETHAWYTRRA